MKDNGFGFGWLKKSIVGIDFKYIGNVFYSLTAFRRNTLHKEKDHLINDYEQNLKLLQTKYDTDVNLLKKEHTLSASKVLYIYTGLCAYKVIYIYVTYKVVIYFPTYSKGSL